MPGMTDKKVKPFKPGVYFGLDEDVYHADPSIGSTDIKKLIQSPCIYWHDSHMNPRRPEQEPNKYKDWGSALHAIVLEGDDVFRANFKRSPSKDDYKDQKLLVTMDDMKVWLADHFETVSGKKDDLIKRVQKVDPKWPIWDVIMKEFDESLDGATALSSDDYDDVVISSAMITKNPSLAHAFVDGAPEVSVFWLENGVPCKARIDYLKLYAVVDLKSFRMKNRLESVEVSVVHAIANMGYLYQAAHYLNGRAAIPEMIRKGQVYGDFTPWVSKEWVHKLSLTTDYEFDWVFYLAEGAPIATSRRLMVGSDAHILGIRRLEEAYDAYRENLERFGTDMWLYLKQPEVLAGEDIPLWVR